MATARATDSLHLLARHRSSTALGRAAAVEGVSNVALVTALLADGNVRLGVERGAANGLAVERADWSSSAAAKVATAATRTRAKHVLKFILAGSLVVCVCVLAGAKRELTRAADNAHKRTPDEIVIIGWDQRQQQSLCKPYCDAEKSHPVTKF